MILIYKQFSSSAMSYGLGLDRSKLL